MDEQKVSEQVAQNLPPSEPQLNPQYPEPEPQDKVNGVPFADYVMTQEAMDYFNFGNGMKNSPEAKEQLQTILAWAKQNAETPDLAGILRAIRHTETGLGNQLKQDRFTRLYRFVRIQQQKSLLAEKERALYQ